jgi:hypothetical protein
LKIAFSAQKLLRGAVVAPLLQSYGAASSEAGEYRRNPDKNKRNSPANRVSGHMSGRPFISIPQRVWVAKALCFGLTWAKTGVDPKQYRLRNSRQCYREITLELAAFRSKT